MYECIVICRYVMKSDAFLCAQSGLMPVSKTDYPKYPLTSGSKPVYSARIQNFHLAVSHLRCFDARLTRGSGEVKFNWWDRNNDFIKGVRRVPPYTDLFWAMFYKLAPFLGGMKKLILEAEDDKDVDDIRRMKVRVPVPDELNEGNFSNVDVPLLSHEVRAMIDNMLFMSTYGHKSMFEDRVPQACIQDFRTTALRLARENESNFYLLWKQYLKRRREAKSNGMADVASRLSDVLGSDDALPAAEEAPAGGAAAAAEGGAAAAADDTDEA